MQIDKWFIAYCSGGLWFESAIGPFVCFLQQAKKYSEGSILRCLSARKKQGCPEPQERAQTP